MNAILPDLRLPPKRAFRNVPLFVLAALTALATEGLILALLWRGEPDHQVGLLFSTITANMSLLGLVVSRAATMRKLDPRPNVAKTAFAARIASLFLILPTVFVGGGAMALKMEDRASLEYASSDAYSQDKRNAMDLTMDSQTRSEAALLIRKAIRPTQARMDDPAYFGSILAFLALALLPLVAIGSGLTFAEETPAQARRRVAEVRAAKAQATRERNKKDEAKKEKKSGLRVVASN